MVHLMTKVDYVLIVVFAWSFIVMIVIRIWCRSHLRNAHSPEFIAVEQSYDRPWIYFLDYPLSECHRNSLTHFLYRTCLCGSSCQDCNWASWVTLTTDVIWLVSGTTLLIRLNFL